MGCHTKRVQRGLRIGFALLLYLRLCFFLDFFGLFFISSLSPSVEIGCVWPPSGVGFLQIQLKHHYITQFY